jgi:hypothetical protein
MSIRMDIYIYIYIFTCIYIHIYIYIYTHLMLYPQKHRTMSSPASRDSNGAGDGATKVQPSLDRSAWRGYVAATLKGACNCYNMLPSGKLT